MTVLSLRDAALMPLYLLDKEAGTGIPPQNPISLANHQEYHDTTQKLKLSLVRP